jgi:predicted Zn-dependent peptidase
VVGDYDRAAVLAQIETHYGDLVGSRPTSPKIPDEPAQTEPSGGPP